MAEALDTPPSSWVLLVCMFTFKYVRRCVDCWDGPDRREAKVAGQKVLSHSHRTQRKRVDFFKLAQTGCACGLLALAQATRLCKHRLASPPGCVLTVMSYRLIGSLGGAISRFFLVSVVLGESLGDGDGCEAIWFCPLMSICLFP